MGMRLGFAYGDVEAGLRHNDMQLVFVQLEKLGRVESAFRSARFWSLKSIQAIIERRPKEAVDRLEEAHSLRDWDAEYFLEHGQAAIDAFGRRKPLFFKKRAEDQHMVMQEKFDELRARFC